MGSDANVIWAPQEGSQTVFLSCPIYEALYEGTRGSQKTDTLIMDFAQHVGVGHGRAWRGILFRQSYKQLSDIVDRTKKWYYQIFPGARFNAADFRWIFQDGEELLLRYMDSPDDYWSYHGHQYVWIGWEELTNWSSRECYDSMKACCRSSDENIPRKYRATCNPWGPGHNWVKDYFITPAPAGKIIENEYGQQRVRIHGSVYENKILLNADPDYIKNLESIEDENKKKAWLYGSWDITAGGALDDVWNSRYHVIKRFRIPHTWIVDRSFDWGSSRPFCVSWWAESDGSEVMLADGTVKSFPRGTIFNIYEYYGWTGKANEGCRMLASDIAENIKEIESSLDFLSIIGARKVRPGPADASIYNAETGVSIAAQMGDVKWVPCDKRPGSRVAGLERVRTYLKNAVPNKDGTPNEEPGLYVFQNCYNFIRTVPVLGRDERNPDDVDTNAEDHVFDTLRYRIMSRKNEGRVIKLAGV